MKAGTVKRTHFIGARTLDRIIRSQNHSKVDNSQPTWTMSTRDQTLVPRKRSLGRTAKRNPAFETVTEAFDSRCARSPAVGNSSRVGWHSGPLLPGVGQGLLQSLVWQDEGTGEDVDIMAHQVEPQHAR